MSRMMMPLPNVFGDYAIRECHCPTTRGTQCAPPYSRPILRLGSTTASLTSRRRSDWRNSVVLRLRWRGVARSRGTFGENFGETPENATDEFGAGFGEALREILSRKTGGRISLRKTAGGFGDGRIFGDPYAGAGTFIGYPWAGCFFRASSVSRAAFSFR